MFIDFVVARSRCTVENSVNVLSKVVEFLGVYDISEDEKAVFPVRIEDVFGDASIVIVSDGATVG